MERGKDSSFSSSEDEHDEDLPVTHFYTTSSMQEQKFKRLPGTSLSFTMRFRNLEDSPFIEKTLKDVLSEVISKASSDFQGSDKMGLAITSKNLDKPLLVPFSDKDKITASKILILAEKIAQSKQAFQLDEDVEVKLTAFPTKMKGGAYVPSRFRGNWKTWYEEETTKNKGCLMKIDNEDDLCGPKALVLAAYYVWSQLNDREMHNRYRMLRRCITDPKKPHLKRVTNSWIRKAGMEEHWGQWSIEDLQELEKANLQPQVRLKVISKDWVDSCIYEGPILPNQKVVHLYLHHGHYSVIKSMAGFYNKNYYCEICNQAFQHKFKHPCTATCKFCGGDEKCKLEQWMECQECHRFFPNQYCKEKHSEGSPSVCNTIHRCTECGIYHSTSKKHYCWLKYCARCGDKHNERLEGPHYCFITQQHEKKKPVKRTHSTAKNGRVKNIERDLRRFDFPDGFFDLTLQEQHKVMEKLDEEIVFDYDPNTSYIFFDMESQQHEQVGQNDMGPIYEHHPNLIIAHKCCDQCKDQMDDTCKKCKKNKHKFWKLEDFCSWLFSKENRGCTAMAHNAKAYDSQFILKYIHEQAILPKVITRGLNLLAIEAAGIRIIDSHSFLPMALSKLPSAFNLTELKKGYFPHLFNRPENMKYIGPLPDAKDYMPDQMNGKAREKFYTWYNANKDSTFNMEKELVDYCTSDVDILRRACLAFRELFKHETGTDPFNKITIASACMHVYRRNFLSSSTLIGLVPPQGYNKNDVQSKIALTWLEWTAQENNIDIQHAKNGGEYKFGGRKIDGVCRCCRTQAFEFLGCLWHGCPKCYKNRDQKLPGSLKTVEMVYQEWLKREADLTVLFKDLTYVWECEVKHELAHCPRMAEFFKNSQVVGPMSPREGLYGGRTNAITLHHKCQPGEEIHYIDVVSLYPYIMKTGMYPIGHPVIHKENLPTFNLEEFRAGIGLPFPRYVGMWKVKMLPPQQNLFHPVLPYRSGDKLTFPLCRTCADTRQMSECEHTPEDRAITGTWTHLEIEKALEHGYTWMESYEAWIYEKMSQMGPKSKGLFSGYVNKFLKLKMEASGWPANVKTDEDKEEYVARVKEVEGISLEPSKVEANPGLRQVAKLTLNTSWGKFAQRNDDMSTIYVKGGEELFKYITAPSMEVFSVIEISPDYIQLTVRSLYEYEEGHATSNPILAAYVTSQARLLLYSYLEKLQERVLYFDTDSIIYLTRAGEEKVKTGSFLGEMTDELEEFGPGAYIQEFVSAGPKNYAFKTINDVGESQTVTKIRGFSLAYSAAQDLNFDSLCRMVKGFVENGGQEEVTIEFPQIKRDKKAQVTTTTSKKTYRVTYDKRRVIQNCFTTVPYGYLSPE